MNRRVERLSSLIKRILAEEITYRMADPRIEPMTSITRVKVSPDISSATVYISVLAEAARQRSCLRALEGARGKLRNLLAKEMQIRHVPELRFELDDSIQRGNETLTIIDDVMREMEPADEDTPTEVESNQDDNSDTPTEKGQ